MLRPLTDASFSVALLHNLLIAGVEAFMDTADPWYPVLTPLPYNVKLGADNPDNL